MEKSDTDLAIKRDVFADAVESTSDETTVDSMVELNERIRGILDEAPSDASAEFEVRKSRGGYRGLLKINSLQGKFIGGGQAKSFSEVVDTIFAQVRAQLRDWRRRRFRSRHEPI